jgi:hypothetical protein
MRQMGKAGESNPPAFKRNETWGRSKKGACEVEGEEGDDPSFFPFYLTC